MKIIKLVKKDAYWVDRKWLDGEEVHAREPKNGVVECQLVHAERVPKGMENFFVFMEESVVEK